jgi:hypothetical protein
LPEGALLNTLGWVLRANMVCASFLSVEFYYQEEFIKFIKASQAIISVVKQVISRQSSVKNRKPGASVHLGFTEN